MKIRYQLYICLLLLSIYPLISNSQVLGPGLKSKEIKVGYLFKWFHRSMSISEPIWAYGTTFVEHGLYKWMTLSVEACAYDFTDTCYDKQYRQFVVGCGLITTILDYKGFRFALSTHYSEIFYLGKSEPNDHQLARNFIGAIQVDKSIEFYNQKFTIWLSPAYVYDNITYWPLGFDEQSKKCIGLAIGINLLLVNHLEPFAHIVYAEFLQPRIGIALRL